MENVDNLIIEHLRAIRADVSAIKDDVGDVKNRMAVLEAAIGGIKHQARPGRHLHGERGAPCPL